MTDIVGTALQTGVFVRLLGIGVIAFPIHSMLRILYTRLPHVLRTLTVALYVMLIGALALLVATVCDMGRVRLYTLLSPILGYATASMLKSVLSLLIRRIKHRKGIAKSPT